MSIKKCTCAENEGCTDECDRGMKFWERAIHEARSLPPSLTREQTLGWVLKRIKELQLTPRDL